jgi:hypothetical protein
MNVKLLQRVKKIITRRPLQFLMEAWFEAVGKADNNCGTAACIAGWVITCDQQAGKKKKLKPLLAAKTFYKDFDPQSGSCLSGTYAGQIQPKAQKILNISSSQAKRLFVLDYWPPQFRYAYHDAYRAGEYVELRR